MANEKQISIVVNPRSFAISKSNDLTGEIFIMCNDAAFPDSSWNDFVVIILTWWIEAIIKLVKGASEHDELLFMDGPFQLSIRVESEGFWRIDCVEFDTSIKYSSYVKSIQFGEVLKQAVDTTILYCVEYGWKPRDLDKLVSMRKQLDEL